VLQHGQEPHGRRPSTRLCTACARLIGRTAAPDRQLALGTWHLAASDWWGSAKAAAGKTRTQIPPPRFTGHTAAQNARFSRSPPHRSRAWLAQTARHASRLSPLTAGLLDCCPSFAQVQECVDCKQLFSLQERPGFRFLALLMLL
jgi:hypothetical protein